MKHSNFQVAKEILKIDYIKRLQGPRIFVVSPLSTSPFPRPGSQVSHATVFKVKKLVSSLKGTSFKMERPENHPSPA